MPERFAPNPATQLALLLCCALCSGCASPGTPRAPSLHLPEPVADLAAERVGDEVHLRWTTPAKTTDGLPISKPMSIVLCRLIAPSTCTPVLRQKAVPGPSHATEILPAPLATGATTLLTYRIEVRNADERSAGLSAAALTVAGPPPPPVAGFHALVTAEGTLLQWEPQDAADVLDISRTSQVTTIGASAPLQRPTASMTVKEPAVRHLRAAPAALGNRLFQADAGGTLDATARRGETYVYTAQRIRSIVLSGQKLELRSAPSPAITVTVRDVFPPRPPAGLAAIANPSPTAPSIDLSWQAGTDEDLAGYRVYRREADAAPVCLTPGPPLPSPAFRDSTVVAGHRYTYTVTALDQAGNESPPGAPVSEELRQP